MKEYINRCSVCKKITITTYDSLNQLNTLKPNPEILFTDGVCSAECAVKGYGLPIEDALEIFNDLSNP